MVLYNICTLGIYGFYWLAATRKEMISRTGARIPSVGRYVALKLLIIASLLAMLWSVYLLSGLHSRPRPAKPPAQCYGRYDVDADCRVAIDNYYVSDHTSEALLLLLLSFMALAALSWGALKWLIPYCEAVERVTDGRNATNNLAFFLLMYWLTIGMVAVQIRFNQFPPQADDSVLPKPS
jgi:hypothetical protein